MNVLLLFFALPIATIIISIALQKIFKCPPLVAAIIFAIFLVITFIVNNINLLIAVIIYTILSYIAALITCVITKISKSVGDSKNCCCNHNELLTIRSRCGNLDNGNLLTISSNCQNGVNNDLLTISSNGDNSKNNNCCCNSSIYNDIGANGVAARINVIPNNTNNGRTGCVCGRYRKH